MTEAYPKYWITFLVNLKFEDEIDQVGSKKRVEFQNATINIILLNAMF